MPDIASTDLFAPVHLGPMTLKNRIIMAPLTRSRAGDGGVPGPLNAEYYAQRASAGLIVSEATNISPQGRGYAYTPGIYSDAQVAGWKLVTDAVHAKGGLIVCQLWHVGRISHPALQPDGALPVAPSAVRPEGKAFTENGLEPHPTPRALELDEIAGVVDQYRHATECARRAGFDGVEIHAANGYLIDQFLRDKTNLRTDAYGGSVENRTRFLKEVVDAVVGAWSADRVGIRFSPLSPFNDIGDSNPEPVFRRATEIVDAAGLLYMHLVEGVTQGPREPVGGFDLQILRRAFKGAYMANNGFDLDLAIQVRASGAADLIAFGRDYIANPDLVERLKTHAPLAELNRATLYGGDAHGYTDYPPLRETVEA
ncbi:MAG: alkene reductase [Caulobacteraceae bacterium]